MRVATPTTRAEHKAWKSTTGHYNQLFRYLSKLRYDEGCPQVISWMELLIDYLIEAGMHVPNDEFAHEVTVGRQAWRFRHFAEKILHDSGIETMQEKIKIHRAMGAIPAAVRGLHLKQPEKVRTMVRLGGDDLMENPWTCMQTRTCRSMASSCSGSSSGMEDVILQSID